MHIDIDHVFISLIHIPRAAVHHYTKVLLSGPASFRHKCQVNYLFDSSTYLLLHSFQTTTFPSA